MKPLRGIGWACALGFLGAGAGPARAAWDNVFQVCCNGCGHAPAVSYYAPDPCNPCPPPTTVCTTRYVQRCYYQPVTVYQTQSYYEPVTTYRTSYYYEPVVSYRYSSYYDPCTGCAQQVACPTTSYRLRSQCCPVQSWVQRCCQVPVTTYRQASYWEPVTTCCSSPAPCCPPPPACPPAAAPAPAAPAYTPPAATPPPPAYGQPGVVEGRSSPPAPAVRESTNGTGAPAYDRYYPAPSVPGMPPASGSSLRPAPSRLPVTPPPPVPVQPPPTVRLEQIVGLPGPTLKGKVVRQDNAPLPNAQLVFVKADRKNEKQVVTADSAGNFDVTLASGGWKVYFQTGHQEPVYHSQIDVRESRQVILVSR